MSEQQHSSPSQTAGVESYVDAQGAAKFLLRSPKTIQSWARTGIIPAHPIGCGSKKHWLFLKSELDAWVRSQVQTS